MHRGWVVLIVTDLKGTCNTVLYPECGIWDSVVPRLSEHFRNQLILIKLSGPLGNRLTEEMK